MLAAKSYVPLLKAKVAEVEAYRQLSSECKTRIFPIFLLRPWQNATHLQLTLDKIQAATGGQNFGLGLDRDRLGYSSNKPAQREFDDLFDSRLGYKNFFDLVAELPEAVPILQPTRDAEVLVRQLGNAEDLERGLIVHQQRDATIPVTETVLTLPPLPSDTVFIVDAGWSRDFLTLQAWAVAQATRIHTVLPDAEIVVMSSSFPDSFTHIADTSEEQAHETQVFDAARRRLQAANLTLGDWASTRLSQSGGGGRIPSRVDLARPASWQIFRAAPDNDPGYAAIARLAAAHGAFRSVPDCMGKRLVAATDGSGAGITGTQINTRARINMHMTIQSGASMTINLDEQPYED